VKIRVAEQRDAIAGLATATPHAGGAEQGAGRPAGAARPWRTHARSCAYLTTVAVGCALVLASFYPGYMSADSLDQLGQARQWVFSDHHPPLMTTLWGLLDRLWPGPSGIVLFHNVCFWSAAALISSLAFRRAVVAVLATLLIGLAPPVFALLGTAWKDVGFACALLLAVALLMLAERTAKRRWIGAAAFFLLYAFSVRHDGGLAVLPVCLWAGALLVPDARGEGMFQPHVLLKGVVAGTALFAALAAVDLTLTRVVVRASRSYPDQVVLVYDLAYLSLLDRQWLLPEGTVEPTQIDHRFAELQKIFDGYDCWSHYCFAMLEFFPRTADSGRIARLRAQWWMEIPRHFKGYLRMKVKLARFGYSFRVGGVAYPFHTGVDPNSLGVSFRETLLNRAVMSSLAAVRNSVLFQAWIYLGALLLLLAFLLIAGPRRHFGPWMVGLGALAKDLVYLVWWPGYDFRYHWWTMLCVLIVPLLLLAERRHAPREPPQPEGSAPA
jgi:hypothetical protein